MGNMSVRGISIVFLGFAPFSIPVSSQSLTRFTSFKVGGIWLADDGKHTDAHGGNIIYVEHLRTYWYDEHRGNPGGASCSTGPFVLKGHLRPSSNTLVKAF